MHVCIVNKVHYSNKVAQGLRLETLSVKEIINLKIKACTLNQEYTLMILGQGGYLAIRYFYLYIKNIICNIKLSRFSKYCETVKESFKTGDKPVQKGPVGVQVCIPIKKELVLCLVGI